MAITKIATPLDHVRSPFTFKTPEGKEARLSRAARISAIALAILGTALGLVASPLLISGAVIFYAYTSLCKYNRIRGLAQKQLEESLQGKIEAIGRWIPKYKAECQSLEPFRRSIETLLAKAKNASDDKGKVDQLLLLIPTLEKCKQVTGELEEALIHYLESQTDLLGLVQMTQAQEALKKLNTYVTESTREIVAMLPSLLEARSINPQKIKDEVTLLNYFPADRQCRERFVKLLDLQFQRHPIVGDGNCGYRSVACGLWPELLERRKNDAMGAQAEEDKRQLELRNSVADYMVKHPSEFEPYCYGESPGIHTFDQYMAKIRKPRNWLGYLELKAVSMAYHVPIHVYMTGFNKVVNNRLLPLICLAESHKKAPIPLYFNGCHYEILTTKPIDQKRRDSK